MKKDGFTLIELLVTMVVLAIMITIAIPVFAVWLPDYRLRAAARDLYSNSQLAKLTAVRNNSNCTIVFTGNDYTVFVDSDNDLEYDVGEEIVTQVSWADYKDIGLDTSQGGGTGLTFMTNDDGLPSIAFRSNGIPIDNAGGLGSGTAFLVNIKGMTRSVEISTVGNVSIQ